VTRSLTLAALMLAALAACAAAQKDKEDKDKDKDKPKAYKTPQDCFDAILAAIEKKDAPALVGTLTPSAQKRMAATSAGQGVHLRALAEGKDKGKKNEELAKLYKPLLDVLDKHGLTEEATKDLDMDKQGRLTTKGEVAAMKLVKDPTAFLTDFMSASIKMDKGPEKKDEPKPKLTDVKIDGDKATATVIDSIHVKQKDKDDQVKEIKRPVEFEKIKGGWRIDPFPESKEKDEKDKKDK
jgi:hypothetical protein